MKLKKKWILSILVTLLVFTTALAIYFNARIKSLSDEMATMQLKSNSVEAIEEVSSVKVIDSLLLQGDYENAHKLSLELKNSDVFPNKTQIDFRYKVASDFVKMNKVLKKKIAPSKASQVEIKKDNIFDKAGVNENLTQALKNAQDELLSLKSRLKQRQINSYFTFETAKGTPLHYVGASSNNQANGYGIAILKSGSRYEGHWKNNLRHGIGKFYWDDGEYYEGEYKNDMRSGTGVYHWGNGDKYIGEWKDDKRNGNGKFYNKRGKVKASGIWKDDKLIEEK